MPPFDMPSLHSRVMPALRLEQADQEERKAFPGYYPTYETDLDSWDIHGERATVFDCRALPPEFVKESGMAAFDDHIALHQPFRLPYEDCYFEFKGDGFNVGILAQEVDMHLGGGPLVETDDGDITTSSPPTSILTEVEFIAFINPNDDPEWHLVHDDYRALGSFFNWTPMDGDPPDREPDEKDFFDIVNGDSEDSSGHRLLRVCGFMLAGAVKLMDEKLLASQHRPDPAPKLTRARLKRGHPRVTSDYYILKVNVAAVRAAARRNPVGSHESPMLHWRRGHDRVLHRGSEFESKTRVKSCLVGDPDKGYAAKGYRLIKEPPMIRTVK